MIYLQINQTKFKQLIHRVKKESHAADLKGFTKGRAADLIILRRLENQKEKICTSQLFAILFHQFEVKGESF